MNDIQCICTHISVYIYLKYVHILKLKLQRGYVKEPTHREVQTEFTLRSKPVLKTNAGTFGKSLVFLSLGFLIYEMGIGPPFLGSWEAKIR